MKQLFSNIQKRASRLLLLTVLAGAIASCDSILDFEEGDCSIKYRVKFRYDYNMYGDGKGLDAFSQEVKSITLDFFDDEGNFVDQRTQEGAPLADGTYAMDVNLDPTKYHLVTWAGLDNESFAIPLMVPNSSKLEDLVVLTQRDAVTRNDEGKYIVDKDLSPLWHGEAIDGESKLATTKAAGSKREKITTIGLVKNTNNIRIVIAQVNQNPNTRIPASRAISDDKFTYAIYDTNGKMNYDNTLIDDNLLTYKPFITETSEIKTRAMSADQNTEEEYPAAVAEFSTARLLETQKPILNIVNKETGNSLLPNESLIGYISLLKQQNQIQMPLQEYLDRENNFGMIFFVDENLTLIKTVIQINDWIVNINDFEL